MTVKRYILAAAISSALNLGGGDAAQATAIDLDTGITIRRIAEPATHASARAAALPAPSMSELPEPEVFAMMLVGLVLIGYRAHRDSSETFKN